MSRTVWSSWEWKFWGVDWYIFDETDVGGSMDMGCYMYIIRWCTVQPQEIASSFLSKSILILSLIDCGKKDTFSIYPGALNGFMLKKNLPS